MTLLNDLSAAKLARSDSGLNTFLLAAIFVVYSLATFTWIQSPMVIVLGSSMLAAIIIIKRTILNKIQTVIPEFALFLIITHLLLLLPISRAYILLCFPLISLYIVFSEKNKELLTVLSIGLLISFAITLTTTFSSVSTFIIPDVDFVFYIALFISSSLAGASGIIHFKRLGLKKELRDKKNMHIETLSTFFNSAPLTMMQLTLDGKVVLANDLARATLLHEHDRFDYPPGVAEMIFESLRSQSTREVVTKVGNKHFHFVCKPTADNDHISLFGEDVTDIQQARSTVQELTDAMEFAADGLGIIRKDGEILTKYSAKIGNSTNNISEYEALIKALELAEKFTKDEITCHLDSELVVKQLLGEYRVKNEKLRELFCKVPL